MLATFLLGLASASPAPGVPIQSATVRVAAAADLQPVLPDILADFEKQTGKHVEVSYASSSVLATQILNGAPFELFLSADMSFPQKLTDAGLADPPIEYAEGTLVLWARNDSPLQPLSLDSLQSAKLHRLAVANPEHAPYGRAARAALEHLHLTAALQSKLIVAENIAQAAVYAETANTDAGLISLTSAATEKFRSEGTYVVIPKDAYPPLAQGAVVLKQSPGAAGGQMLLEFLLRRRRTKTARATRFATGQTIAVDWQALSVTLRLAIVTTILLLAFALPLAWWLAHGRSGWRTAVELVTTLPLVLPPTVLGFYLLLLLGPATATGRALTRWIGHPLTFTFTGLVIGSVLYSLPFAVQPLRAGFASVPLDWLETAATLGAGRWQRFWRVLLPSAKLSIAGAAALVFAHTVGEFGVVLMLGGNIPGATRTLSLVVYDQVQDFHYAAADRTALLLVALSAFGLFAIYLLRMRSRLD